MLLGKIVGKTTTKEFKCSVSTAKQFEYVQIMHKEYGYVLAQITEIEQEKEQIASCQIIGYEKNGKRELPRSPLEQGSEVLSAQNELVKKVLNISQKNGAFIGKLENRDIPIYLDLNTLLTKHIAILAKTGAGKSYTSGILIEEILDRNIPLLIIDPHGEYAQIKKPNEKEKDILKEYKLEPKAYPKVVEYGDNRIDEHIQSLHLSEELTAQEMLHILPAKLSQSQKALLYTIIKDLSPITLNNLMEALAADQDISSVNLLSIIDYVKSLQLFSTDYTPYEELIQPGKCSILNLKGIPPEVQEIIVYKLLKDLFEQRKLGNIPPFFTVVEEVHNFAPERSFGEAKSSSIIRTIASEGRKFGLGLCVVTQRPARLDKNVLSQCNTQVILKVTNPLDLKSITSSVENITNETAQEVKNLPIGTALVTGVVDIPLLVKIRPRKSVHGGATVNILDDNENMLKDVKSFESKEILPLVLPKISRKELALMEGNDQLAPVLIPAYVLTIKAKKPYRLLVEAIKGHIVKNRDAKQTVAIPKRKLSKSQSELFETICSLKKFTLVKLGEKSNKSILNLKDELMLFEKQGLIEKNADKYELTESAKILTATSDFQFIDKIEYKQLNYQSKLKAKLTEQEVKERFDFVEVSDVKKCFMVYYKVG